jgi:hypothetical protein
MIVSGLKYTIEQALDEKLFSERKKIKNACTPVHVVLISYLAFM